MGASSVTRRALYERQVRALARVAQQLLDSGWSEERTARHLVTARNRLKILARRHDPPAGVAMIEARNIAKYVHPIGPTADQLYRRYGSWRAIIDAVPAGAVELSNRWT